MIAVNSSVALFYLFDSANMRQAFPNSLPGLFLILAIFGIFNVVCYIELFQWKKWCFYGFVISSIIAIFINLAIVVGVAQSLADLIGIAILYGVLNIGKERAAWAQLE